MADDIKTVEDAIEALISPLVRPGNFISASRASQQVVSNPRGAERPRDFPKIYLERGRSRRQPFTNTPTFGLFSGTACARIELRSQEFIITTVADKQGDIEAGQVDADAQTAIIGMGAQLGLPAIVRIVEEIASTNELTSRGKAKGTERRIFTTTIRVGMRKAV